MIAFSPATGEDAVWIASRLRPEDAREVQTATGTAPEVAVPRSLAVSRITYAIRYTTGEQTDEHPLALFGVADDPHAPGLGIVWLLGTRDIRKAWLALLQAAPYWLDKLSEGYPDGLHNLVDARNLTHLRWLKLTRFRNNGVVHLSGHPFIHAVRTTGKQCVNPQR